MGGGVAVGGNAPAAGSAGEGAVGMRPKVHRLTGAQQDTFRTADWGAVLHAVRAAAHETAIGRATSEAAFAAFEKGVLGQIATC